MRVNNKAERIRALNNGKRTAAEIAAIVGCSPREVRRALHDSGQPKARVTAPTKAKKEGVA